MAQRGEHGGQPGGHGRQQLVPGVVAEAVVDDLEAVQVDVAEPEPGAGLRRLEHRLQPLEEGRPVQQPGQLVMGGLEAQPLLQPVAVGDVLQHRHLVLRPLLLVPDQGHREVGPDHLAVVPVVRLVELEVVPLAGDQLAVGVPDAGGVLRVDQVVHPPAGQVLRPRAEQLQQRRVDLQDPALQVADPDADRGALEQCPEPRLGGVQRPLRALPGGVRRQPDALLLAQRLLAQRHRPAGREGPGQGRAPGPVQGLPLEQGDHPGQHPGVGVAGVHQQRPDLLGRPGVERVAVPGLPQQLGGPVHQPPDHGRGQHPPVALVQQRRPGLAEGVGGLAGRGRGGAHGRRPTPAIPVNRSGWEPTAPGFSGCHSGR